MRQDFSPRERDVVRLVAEGKTNNQIARETSLALPTVKNYVANAMHKAGVDNRTNTNTAELNNPYYADF